MHLYVQCTLRKKHYTKIRIFRKWKNPKNCDTFRKRKTSKHYNVLHIHNWRSCSSMKRKNEETILITLIHLIYHYLNTKSHELHGAWRITAKSMNYNDEKWSRKSIKTGVLLQIVEAYVDCRDEYIQFCIFRRNKHVFGWFQLYYTFSHMPYSIREQYAYTYVCMLCCFLFLCTSWERYVH